MDKKQHIYHVMVVKRDYHHIYVKAFNEDEAEEIVIEQILENPDDSVLDAYWDDSECEAIALERVKKPSKALKTIN